MKKKFRVKKNQEFQSILGQRQFVNSDSFTIYYRTRSLDHSRVGISASKKLGNAVVRNKVKRQIRMICQQILSFDEEIDIIVLARKKYFDYSFKENIEQFNELMKKIKIRRK